MNATISTLDPFTRAYLECALWSSTGDDGAPLDASYTSDDIAPESLTHVIECCRQFQADNATDLADIDPGQAGHDFWLTRNHHGAGFWDRGLGDVGKRLTTAAHAWGDSTAYVGDDGKVYLTE